MIFENIHMSTDILKTPDIEHPYRGWFRFVVPLPSPLSKLLAGRSGPFFELPFSVHSTFSFEPPHLQSWRTMNPEPSVLALTKPIPTLVDPVSTDARDPHLAISQSRLARAAL